MVQSSNVLSSFRKGLQEAIGLDIGSSSVKAIGVLRTPKDFRLTQAAFAQIPPPATIPERVRAIQQVLQSLDHRTTHLLTAVSGAGAVVRCVVLPKMTPQELREALAFEAEKYIPFKPEETYLDFSIVGDQPDGRMEVLLAAAKRDLVNAHLDLLKAAQVSPKAVDLEMLALNNGWEVSHPPGGTETVALVHVGARATILVLLEGSQFRFGREIPVGGETFTQAVAQALKLDVPEAERIKCQPQHRLPEVQAALGPHWEEWLSQCRISFDFYEDHFGRGVQRLMLSGGSASLNGFRDWIQRTSAIPTEVWDPLAGLTLGVTPERVEPIRGSLGVAVGLAVRELAGGGSLK